MLKRLKVPDGFQGRFFLKLINQLFNCGIIDLQLCVSFRCMQSDSAIYIYIYIYISSSPDTRPIQVTTKYWVQIAHYF